MYIPYRCQLNPRVIFFKNDFRYVVNKICPFLMCFTIQNKVKPTIVHWVGLYSRVGLNSRQYGRFGISAGNSNASEIVSDSFLDDVIKSNDL